MNHAATLIAKCFEARTAAHLAHLSTQSYSKHKALDDFYNDIVEATDEYAEVYMGLEGRITAWPKAECSEKNILDCILELIGWLEENRSKCAYGHRALENLIDNITAVAARTVYKLENLK